MEFGRRMKILGTVFFGFLINIAHSGADQLPRLLNEVKSLYQKSDGIEARFNQLTEIKATKQTKKADGRIWIKRPSKLRWETINPDPNILVSDGRTFWFYTPPFEKGERGQVIIKKSAQVQTQFLNALLSGSFDFKPGTLTIEDKGERTFMLKPKAGTAGDVSSAQIKLDKNKALISEVTLEHTSGNKTEIKLQEISLTSKLEEKLFHFVPDRNTDKISE